ncbi:MAG: amidohydrolase family protein [Clostridia bacterium]|nr:amidohydrolase family protein [Clostridia bacterium]
MKVFDGHLHTFRFKVPMRESIDLFKRQFERFHVEKMTFLALPLDALPGKVEFDKTDRIDNLRVMYFKSVFSPNAYAYAGLEYIGLDSKDKKAVAQSLLEQVKEYKRVGYDGMKMYEGHPNHRKLLGYPLYDEIFDEYYNYCEKENFPIIMHLANPAYMWEEDKVSDYWKARGCYFDETYPTFAQFHEEILKRLEKNPKLNFTLAHWGFLTYNKTAAEKFMSYENTKLDVCPGGDNFFNILADKEYWLPFLEKYADRITYGTDSYNFEYDNEENWLRATGNRPLLVQNFLTGKLTDEFDYLGRKYNGAGLTKETQEKILYENLNKMLGEPKEIDYDYLIAKCEKMIQTVDENSLDRYNLWCMKNDFESMKKGAFAYDKEF